MSNELRILPLRKYEVTYMMSVNQNDEVHKDVFTADFHNVIDNRNLFYRTGHVIREYQTPYVIRIVVTPVDDEEK